MNSLRAWIAPAAAAVVGGTFVVAGALKSLDVEGFARDISLHGIVGPAVSAVAARVLVPFEIAVGAAAIVGWRRRTAVALLAGALVVFIAATGWAWAHGNTEGCGCFGRYASRTPLAVIVEDLLLLGAACVALAMDRKGDSPGAVSWQQPALDGSSAAPEAIRARRRSWRPALVVFIAIAASAFALASPHLPIDNLATALRPGVSLHALGLDAVAGNLAEGDRVLVILVLDQPASQKAIPALNDLARPASPAPIAGLTSASEHARAEFFWTYAPSFDLLEIPAADLRRLYRTAPRTFRVHNGRVLQVWEGVPPAEELAK